LKSNADRALMTQMTAQVFFVIGQAKDAVQIPITALRSARANGSARKSAPRTEAGAAGSANKSGAPAREAADARSGIRDGRASVRVVKADGTIEDREVRVGVMNRVSVQIVAGLEPGEQVVTGSAVARPAAANKSGNSNAPRMQPRI